MTEQQHSHRSIEQLIAMQREIEQRIRAALAAEEARKAESAKQANAKK